MIFNSIEFLFFFPIVFILYWLVFNRNLKLRNSFLLITSYFFYGFWDWRFLSLIIISSFVDFYIGKLLHTESNNPKRKRLLFISLFVNLGILGFFKYFNFFLDSFIDSFTLLGMPMNINRLDIILPVGISFYTFQTLSYTIDSYYKKIEPEKNIIAFFTFVSFFPQLVAGPIERAKHLLPQFNIMHKADYDTIKKGLIIATYGLFLKIVIADRLAIFVDSVYGDIEIADRLSMMYAIIFFPFQLYIDFSAYSLIAIGLSQTLGFDLCTNFNRPYLSISFSDFWSRWHISLSSWFRDYLYIPLGGNQKGGKKKIINLLIVFILSGLWHGASWNFVIWGGLNGLFLILFDKILMNLNSNIFQRIFNALFVFFMWAFSLIFFRAQSFGDAITGLSKIGFESQDKYLTMGLNETEFQITIYLIVFLLLFEILQEKYETLYQWFISRWLPLRYIVYIALIASILLIGSYGEGLNDKSFIYFQF